MAKKHKKVAAAQDMETPAVELENPVVETSTQETSNEEVPATKPVKVRYAKRDWASTDIITLVQPNNPKSGKSKNRYDLYTNGMSVADYATAVVNHGGSKTLANADLRWDVARGFITIAPAAQ
jgi:hypothetical protein